MASEGFSRFILSDNGRTFYLPRGEYTINSSEELAQVLVNAENAVQSTGKSAEILVTESNGCTWSGLTPKG